MAAPTRPTPSTASYLARMGAHTEPTQFLVKNQNKHRHTPRWAADFMNPAAHHHGHIPPPAGLDSPWLRRPTKKTKKMPEKKNKKRKFLISSFPLLLSVPLRPPWGGARVCHAHPSIMLPPEIPPCIPDHRQAKPLCSACLPPLAPRPFGPMRAADPDNPRLFPVSFPPSSHSS